MRIENFLRNSAERIGAQGAVVAAGRTHSYGQLHLAAERVAAALVERGVQSGDRVGVLMESGFVAVAVAFGVLMAGGTVWFIGKEIEANALAGALIEQEAVALATEVKYAARSALALAQAEAVRVVLLSGGDAATSSPDCLSVEHVLRRFGPRAVLPVIASGEQAALILGGFDDSEEFARPVTLVHAELIAGAECTAPQPGTRLRSIFSFAGFCHLIQAIRMGVTIELETPVLRDRGSREPVRGAGLLESGWLMPAAAAG